MTGPARRARRHRVATLAGEPPGIASRVVRRLGASIVAVLTVSGCANPFSPEGTNPGVYKGASDPLFEQPAAERDAALRERFELIQRR